MLTVTEMLRKHGVVGKFVEFYGEGVAEVPLANRATLGNMSPEFGSTAAIFPIDEETIYYLRFTGRKRGAAGAGRGLRQRAGHVARPRATSPRSPSTSNSTCPTWCRRSPGPKRPQDRIALSDAKSMFRKNIHNYVGDDPDKQEYSKLDEAVDESFPASDPGRRRTATPTTRRRCTRPPRTRRAGRATR